MMTIRFHRDNMDDAEEFAGTVAYVAGLHRHTTLQYRDPLTGSWKLWAEPVVVLAP